MEKGMKKKADEIVALLAETEILLTDAGVAAEAAYAFRQAVLEDEEGYYDTVVSIRASIAHRAAAYAAAFASVAATHAADLAAREAVRDPESPMHGVAYTEVAAKVEAMKAAVRVRDSDDVTIREAFIRYVALMKQPPGSQAEAELESRIARLLDCGGTGDKRFYALPPGRGRLVTDSLHQALAYWVERTERLNHPRRGG